MQLLRNQASAIRLGMPPSRNSHTASARQNQAKLNLKVTDEGRAGFVVIFITTILCCLRWNDRLATVVE